MERRRDRRALEWNDSVELPEGAEYEAVYRDGSLKNECWHGNADVKPRTVPDDREDELCPTDE